jgi:hypothetical protein
MDFFLKAGRLISIAVRIFWTIKKKELAFASKGGYLRLLLRMQSAGNRSFKAYGCPSARGLLRKLEADPF